MGYMNRYIPSYVGRISEGAFIFYFFILSFFPFNADILKYLCILIVTGCWVAKILYERRNWFVRTSLNIPAASFLLCLLFASFHSSVPAYSLHTLVSKDVIYLLIFFCMVNTLQGQEQVSRIVIAMLITCGMVCAYGLYGYYTGIAICGDKLSANFEISSRMAKYISLLLPLAICLFFYYRRAVSRLCLFFLICACGFSLILTMSRASWIAMTIVFPFICFSIRKKFLLLVTACVCIMIVFLLPPRFLERAKTLMQTDTLFSFKDSREITGQRFLCWRASIAMFREHPLFGIGHSSRIFRHAYQVYGKKIQAERTVQQRSPAQDAKAKTAQVTELERLSHPHNIFLDMGVGAGIIGLLPFLWLFATVFFESIKSLKLATSRYKKMLLLGITGSLISIFLHGLTDSFWKKPDALFLWYIIGILFIVIRDEPRTTNAGFNYCHL